MSLKFRATVAMTFLVVATPTAAIDLLPPETPGSFGVDARSVIVNVNAVGLQIYECKPYVEGLRLWIMRESIATLFRDEMVVGYYSGGWWTFTDGSAVKGKVIDLAAPWSPGGLAQLEFDVTDHRGVGRLSPSTTVLEVGTGGGALQGSCTTSGLLQAVPYRATYAFLR